MKLRRLSVFIMCVFLVSAVRAQENVQQIRRLVQNVFYFNREFQQEKVFLQFDNTSYFQGETIWFKAFVVNASDLTRSSSGVLYVELLSPTGVLLQQQKLKVIYGQADGCIRLIDNAVRDANELRGEQPYPSGYYEVRAYTKYMMNFSEKSIFSRVLPVFKSPVAEGQYDTPSIIRSEKNRNNVREEYRKLKEVNVSFYPEGGILHQWVPGRVAFKVTDEDEMPIDGVLRVNSHNSKGDVITAPTVHDGMGSFDILPGVRTPGYVFTYNGKEYKVNGPAPDSGQGINLKVDQMDDSISVTVYNALRYTTTIGFAVCCRGQVYHSQAENLGKDSLHVTIPTADIPMGVCQLTIIDHWGSVLATRHFFNFRDGYSPPALSVKPDKAAYAPYEQVKMELSLTGTEGEPLRDRFCLSVRDGNNIKTACMDNLATSMLLSSDLKGLILNPEYYFEADDAVHRQAMDLLMMVQGWERYDFRTMESHNSFKERYRKEETLQLNGYTVQYLNSHKKNGEVDAFLSLTPVSGDSLIYYGHYRTGENGYFGFDLSDFYSKAAVFIRLSRKNILGNEKRLANMVFERGNVPSARTFRPEELKFGFEYSEIISHRDNDAVSGKGNIDEGIRLPEVEILAPRKYIDYFTFKAIDVERDVEVQLDIGEFPASIMGYLLDNGYKIDNRFDALSYPYNEKDINIPQNFIKELRNFGPEAYAFQESGLIDQEPVFWYVHDSNGLRLLPKRKIWEINTRNVESLLVFDEPATLPEIAESVPLLMKSIAQNKNIKAQTVMNGDYTQRKFRLVEVRLKDKMMNEDELHDLGKRSMTFDGFNFPVQFYSPQYPDGPVEGTNKDYRRTLYWNPNVITDSLGHAQVEFYNNSYSTGFNVSGAGITAGGSPYVLDENF